MTRGNKYVYNILRDLLQEKNIHCFHITNITYKCFSEQDYDSTCYGSFVSHVLIF